MSAVTTEVGAATAPFRVGSALSRALSLFKQNFGKFFILAAIPQLLTLIPPAAVTLGLIADGPPQHGAAYASGGFLFGVLLSSLTIAACLPGAYYAMRGQSFGIGQSLRDGLRRLPAIFGVSLIETLLIALGLLLLIVPGLMIACALYISTPVCVVERAGIGESFRRSRELTVGSRWAIFSLLLLFFVLAVLVGGGLGFVIGLVMGFLQALLHVTTTATGLSYHVLISFLAKTLVGGFNAILVAVVYHDLRVAKEGVDIEDIAKVFD